MNVAYIIYTVECQVLKDKREIPKWTMGSIPLILTDVDLNTSDIYVFMHQR